MKNLKFGSVFEFHSTHYIFLHCFENFVTCFTMDYRRVSFNSKRFRELSLWQYQLPVKFYKGYDYCFTDDRKIIHEFPGTIEAFSPEITDELIAGAANSPYPLLRNHFNSGKYSKEQYNKIAYGCLSQHYKSHKHEYAAIYA